MKRARFKKLFWCRSGWRFLAISAVGLLLAGGWPPATARAQSANVSAELPRSPGRLELDDRDLVLAGQFAAGTEWQEVRFNRPVSGRYFCLESLSAFDGRDFAAVAELDLIGTAGQTLARRGWKVIYADSEEHDREDGSAENVLDGRPETYWHTQWSRSAPGHPHHLVLDLGRSETVAGFRYLPRAGDGMVGGRIKDYRIYLGDSLVAENSSATVLPEKCYLFNYFTGNSEDGLHLAYSLNGYRWDVMNHGRSVLKPAVSAGLMRDPFLLLATNGVFHLVWTAAWNGNGIGYASSTDLVHWSAQRLLPLMTNFPGTMNCWAPEIFWDQDRQEYLIYWASTVTNQFTGAAGKNGQADNNRIYATTTKDFQTFSETRLFFDPGFNLLDATLFADKNRCYLVFKDCIANHIRMAVADHAWGPFRMAGPISEADSAEGPMLFRVSGQIVLGYSVPDNRSGALKTADLEHWEDISSGMFLPPGCRQGSVMELPREKLPPLLAAGWLQLGTTPEASELGLGDWIWTTNVADRQTCRLWRAFDVPPSPPVVAAELRMTADNSYTVYLDGREIGRGGDPNSLAEYDLTLLMSPGRHVLAVEAFNDTLDAGMILGLRIKLGNGKKMELFSDASWRVAAADERGWKIKTEPDSSWVFAKIVGYAGKAWWQHPYKIIQVPPLQPTVVHFWQRGWVLAVLLLACLTVAVLWVRQGLRLALQTRANRLLERERARIARDMHDDLGSGLTQLTLLGELVLRETPRTGDSRNRLNELCAKSRSLLSSMDEIVWTVNPRRDTVKDFAAFISEHAQEFLATTAIRCRQEVAEELPVIPLDLPQRRNLLLAVKEALRNAARHSGANEITLRLAILDHALKVVVEDNGRGFPPGETQSERNGLTNMQQRLADIGGTFTVDTSPGKGCRITFLLPLQA